MVETLRDLDDFEIEPLPEVPRVDPIQLSEEYFDRGRERMRKGKILDGLVDLHLAKDHLVGKFAPYGIKQNRSLERTLGELDPAIERARAELRLYGPLRTKISSDADVADDN